jgi:hypothetical protein
MDRHTRQMRLDGVGASGQARIASTRADVGLDGLAADVAARYLAGAGVGGVRVRTEAAAHGARALDADARVEVVDGLPDSPEASAMLDVRDPIARELARGALLALRVLRSALGGSPAPEEGRS